MFRHTLRKLFKFKFILKKVFKKYIFLKNNIFSIDNLNIPRRKFENTNTTSETKTTNQIE